MMLINNDNDVCVRSMRSLLSYLFHFCDFVSASAITVVARHVRARKHERAHAIHLSLKSTIEAVGKLKHNKAANA